MIPQNAYGKRKDGGKKTRIYPAAAALAAVILCFAAMTGMACMCACTSPADEPAAAIPADIAAGDRVAFGRWPQSITSGGDACEPEPIEWRVLDVQDGKALLISENLLDCKQYDFHETWNNMTWKNCSLRKWLNGKFYNTAFSAGERARIVKVRNGNPDNPDWGTKGCRDTEDRVFCLSVEEARKYFDDSSKYQNEYTTYPDRMAMPTEYAIKNGAFAGSNWGTGWWWLRSPGYYGYYAALVSTCGNVDSGGSNVFLDMYCVRPAVWVSLGE